jgi:hypothetical protein
MTCYESTNRGPIKAHFMRKKRLTASFAEYQEFEWHEEAHTRGGSGGAADFAGWSSPAGQGGEFTDVEEIEEDEPSPPASAQKPSFDEWLVPGTEARIRICAPADGLGELEPSGTTPAYGVARELQMLHEFLGGVRRPKTEPVTLEAVDFPPED